jgi:MFS transporter, NNP family, nitrate/nitrite transporter
MKAELGCRFNVKIVGVANATTGGWGNLGGGVTQLLMPLIYDGMTKIHQPFIAWRWAMFVPGFFHILAGALTFTWQLF